MDDDDVNLEDLKDVEGDEERLFLDSGYMKPPKKFKKRHNFGTGPKTFDKRFPNPRAFLKKDETYEYIIYRWKRDELDDYQQIKNLEEKEEGESDE